MSTHDDFRNFARMTYDTLNWDQTPHPALEKVEKTLDELDLLVEIVEMGRATVVDIDAEPARAVIGRLLKKGRVLHLKYIDDQTGQYYEVGLEPKPVKSYPFDPNPYR